MASQPTKPRDLPKGAYWYMVPGKEPTICEKREGEAFVRFTQWWPAKLGARRRELRWATCSVRSHRFQLNKHMKKLEPKDLQGLSENDQGLLFNYFGAIGGVVHRRKLALGSALIGCLLIGMAYFLDGIISEVPNVPEWFPMAQWVAKVAPGSRYACCGLWQPVDGEIMQARSAGPGQRVGGSRAGCIWADPRRSFRACGNVHVSPKWSAHQGMSNGL